MTAAGQFIGGAWRPGGGDALVSVDPATGAPVWRGRAAAAEDLDVACAAARAALPGWRRTPFKERCRVLDAYAAELDRQREPLARTISEETGKPLWEARTETAAMVAKVGLTREAYAERVGEREFPLGTVRGVLRARPVGVLGVLGPFNLPGHLPNGHMVPALLSGNGVVFKPSEHAPRTAIETVSCWERAGLPGGVLNLVQGGGAAGRALAGHPALDGLLFTGSWATGQALHRQFGGHPHKVLALEMGGNNPLVVWDSGDPAAAARIALLSSFITAGQRCTCARRLILPRGEEGDRVLANLAAELGELRVGPWDAAPEPFMGPLVSVAAAERLLEAEAVLRARGGASLVSLERLPGPGAFLRPGLIDVSDVAEAPDEEWFGPLLQVVRVATFQAALEEAGRTAYGLAAGLVSAHRGRFETFRHEMPAGVLAWNRPTTGASGRLPFGGVGRSGNHCPSGFWAVDYCSDPVASLESDTVDWPDPSPPGLGSAGPGEQQCN